MSNLPVIVLVTVNAHETTAVLDAFVGEGKSPSTETRGEVTYNLLGVHGDHEIVHSFSEMGSDGVGASSQCTRDAIDHWTPRAVIAVGIAFGVNEEKQAIGDVLVSRKLQGYDHAKVNASGELTPRGDTVPCSQPLLKRLLAVDGNRKRSQVDWPRVRFGFVLSGQKLVDNLDYRENLKTSFPDAIGGEMEGVGVYASAYARRTDWIIVKAICDWGHYKANSNKEVWQQLAAKNAAFVVKAALDEGALYTAATIGLATVNAGRNARASSSDSLSNDDRNLLEAIGRVNLSQERSRLPLMIKDINGTTFPPKHLLGAFEYLAERRLIELPADRVGEEASYVTMTTNGFEEFLTNFRPEYEAELIAIEGFLVRKANTTDMEIVDSIGIKRVIVEHVLCLLAGEKLISLSEWNTSMQVFDVSERLRRKVSEATDDESNGAKEENAHPLRITFRLKEVSGQRTIEVMVHADRSVDDVGVILVGCDPAIDGVDFSPLRPTGGSGETDRVSVHPGAPQKFSLASCPQFHRDVHLLAVHPGTRKSAGLKAVASPDFKLRQDFRLLASGRDATSEEVTLRLTKEREDISIEQI